MEKRIGRGAAKAWDILAMGMGGGHAWVVSDVDSSRSRWCVLCVCMDVCIQGHGKEVSGRIGTRVCVMRYKQYSSEGRFTARLTCVNVMVQ